MRQLNRPIRMVVFDLDGTLTPVDSLWRHLHDALGTWEHGKAAAKRYRNGEISYKVWAETDAHYWAGAPMPKVKSIIDGVPYREGAKEVFRELRQRGVKTVILSAGLSLLAERAASELGADLALANVLRTEDGRLTGEIEVKVAVNNKEQIVRELAFSFNIPLQQTALVGDRAFDLANQECLKIALMPKDDGARNEAHYIIESGDLRAILQYLI